MLILRRDRGDSQDVFDKNVLSRCDLFLKGEWPRLYNAALRRNNECNAQARRHASKHGDRPSENADWRVRQEAATEQARLNNLGKAVNILTSSGLAAYAFPELCRHLQTLHPEEEVSTDGMGDPGSVKPDASTWDFFGVKALRKQIRKCKQGSAVDLWGWEARGMLRGALYKDQLADLLVEVVCRPLLEGYLPLDYQQFLAGGRLVGLSKAPKEGVRPICIGDLFRRLVAKALIQRCGPGLHSYFQKAHPRVIQFGANTLNGATNCFTLLEAIAHEAAKLDGAGEAVALDPIVIIPVDLRNAFNVVSRQALFNILSKGYEARETEEHGGAAGPGAGAGGGSGTQQAMPKGWDLLWRHVLAHYGVEGILHVFRGGQVHQILSQAGLHQGDPLASSLFDVALHPTLIRVAKEVTGVFLGGFQDNIHIIGRLSDALRALDLFADYVREDLNLELNPRETECYVPGWQHLDLVAAVGLPVCVTLEGEEGAGGSIRTPGGRIIPWRQQGIKTLGCPLGSDGFSDGFLAKLAEDINGDLKAIETIPSKHLQLRLATWCTGSRTNYYLRAIDTQRGANTWRIIDSHFDDFLARVLGVDCLREDGSVQRGLAQLRLGMGQGGIGMVQAHLVESAAQHASAAAFQLWCRGHQGLQDCRLPGFQMESIGGGEKAFQLISKRYESARQALLRDWVFENSDQEPDDNDENEGGEDCISELQLYKRKNKVKRLCTLQALHTWNRKHIPTQQGISLTIKEQNGRKFRDTAGDKDKFRLDFVSRQSFPLAHTSSRVRPLPPGAPECKQRITFSPMALFGLFLQPEFELSDHACMAFLCLQAGMPVHVVPHGLTVDEALCNSWFAGGTRLATHNAVLKHIAEILQEAGIKSLIEQRDIRSIGANRRKPDLVTLNKGIPRGLYCAMDLVISHMMCADGRMCKDRIRHTIAYKDRRYQHYVSRFMQVLTLAANAWGWVEADWARMLHECAERCARTAVGCGEGDHALSLQAQEVEDERLLDFQRLRAYHYQRFRLKTLHAIAEGVTTRLAGRQEMPAPNLGYRSVAYHEPTWVPFQFSRASQPVPSQEADVLVSGPDGPSYVDSREFPEADLSDCDEVPELSVGSLGDVGRGSAPGLRAYGSTHLRAGSGSGRGRAGCRLAASYHVPPMSSRQRLPRSVSESAPLDPLRVSSQVFSSSPTFASTLLSPFGSVSDSTATFPPRV